MQKNPISLAFTCKATERAFLIDNIRNSLLQTRLAVILGVILYVMFAYLDFLTIPQEAQLIIGVRFIYGPVVFLTAFWFTFIFRPKLELILTGALVLGQLGHVALYYFGGTSNEYFYGVTLIILLYLLTFCRIRFRFSLLLAFFILASYEVTVLIAAREDFIKFLVGNYFLLSLGAVGVLSAYSIERHIRLDFLRRRELDTERRRSETLLLNILPREIAGELKKNGYSTPVRYDCVSVMFADFVDFSRKTLDCPPGTLVHSLDRYFSYFDQVVGQYGLEKIKTIGDSYMVASGLPRPRPSHAVDCVLAAMDFIDYVRRSRLTETADTRGLDLDIRIGIHVGPVIAGVLGKSKFAYDIFGSTVNMASRMESSSDTNMVNISLSVKDIVEPFFICEPRGRVAVKHGLTEEMFWVQRIRPELSLDEEGMMPGAGFVSLYEALT